MKKLGTLLLALVAVLFWVIPSFAGKVALNEDELDQLTAAGQPTVIQASGATNTVTLTDSMKVVAALGGGVQTLLKALTINNVVGENEVSSQGNIVSTSSVTSQASQSNTINQSWGSVLDLGLLAEADAKGGSGTFAGPKCVFGPCGVSGKSASNSALRLSAYADVIINALATSGNTVVVTETPNFELDLGGATSTTTPATAGAQDGLAALIVNNVAGRNLVANAVNIAAGTVDLTATPSISASGGAGTNQLNVIRQFRGTPIGATVGIAGTPLRNP